MWDEQLPLLGVIAGAFLLSFAGDPRSRPFCRHGMKDDGKCGADKSLFLDTRRIAQSHTGSIGIVGAEPASDAALRSRETKSHPSIHPPPSRRHIPAPRRRSSPVKLLCAIPPGLAFGAKTGCSLLRLLLSRFFTCQWCRHAALHCIGHSVSSLLFGPS